MDCAGRLEVSQADDASVDRPLGYPSNLPDVPAGWERRPAANSRGTIFQRPAAIGNANSIRIMNPTPRYPRGYLRFYNSAGQPLDVNGRAGPPSVTPIALDFAGPWPGWPTSNEDADA
jgi:hypothetical protein